MNRHGRIESEQVEGESVEKAWVEFKECILSVRDEADKGSAEENEMVE